MVVVVVDGRSSCCDGKLHERKETMATKIRIGAMISGGGTNLQAIIDACEANTIDGRIVFVGSDKGGVRGLERARHHNIDTFVVDYGDIIRTYRDAPEKITPPSDFDLDELRLKQSLFGPHADSQKVAFFLITRAIAEAKLLEHMAAYDIDLLVLAGFMRNLTPYFIDRFNSDPDHPRIMNIHPALLPAFPGVDGYGDTYRYGCRVGGCTVHFIDYGEDSGPIIGQKSFPIADDDSLDEIKKRGLEFEWQLYPACVQLFAQNRLQVVTMTHTLDNGQAFQRKIVKILKNSTIDT
jgi:phosphoribosylglycinamide formyltransferase-1